MAQEQAPTTAHADDLFDGADAMSFGDHLEELRRCVLLALLGVAATATICLIYGLKILHVILFPLLVVQSLNDLQPSILALSPTAGFAAYLKIGMISGVILAMPWVLYQAWSFVASGLYENEKRFARRLIVPSIALFAAGVLFMYFIVLPIILQFFISFNRSLDSGDLMPSGSMAWLLQDKEEEAPQTVDVQPLVIPVLGDDPEQPADGAMWINTKHKRVMVKTSDGIYSAALEPAAVSPVLQSEFAIDFYISFVLTLALAFGLAFETPLVVFFLAWTGLVTPSQLAGARKHVILGTVIAAGILTPPDVFSQLLLAGPMYLLFEGGLLVARLSLRHKARTAADGPAT